MKIRVSEGRAEIRIERGDEFNILDGEGYFGMVRFLDEPVIYLPADYKIQPWKEEEKPVEMKQVVSSNVHAYGYDPAEKHLRVQFMNGTDGDYMDVTQEEFDGLEAAKSKGQYINQVIKGKKKPWTKHPRKWNEKDAGKEEVPKEGQ